jgi:ribonuclease P protein component
MRLARLKRRSDFLRVAARRHRAVRPGLILQAAPRPADEPGDAIRVGFTASRRVGNAVVRNRAKRRLRAAAAEVLTREARDDADYVLIARAAIATRAYGEIVGDLAAAMRQLNRPQRVSGGGEKTGRGAETSDEG